jgi:hypothetical protein
MTKPNLIEYSTEELIKELKDRSVGCVIVSMKVSPNGKDEWNFSCKGSTIMIGSMLGYQDVSLKKAMGQKIEPDNPYFKYLDQRFDQ